MNELPVDVKEETPVIVTFLHQADIDLRSLGIDKEQASELRARLACFAEEWESSEMGMHDDYDALRPATEPR